MDKITGYKGFDKDLKCRGYQYKTGEDYKEEGEIVSRFHGFHFVNSPLRAFALYPPCDSRYCKVEGYGEIDFDGEFYAASQIHIGDEIGLIDIAENLEFTMFPGKAELSHSVHTSGNSSITGLSSDSSYISVSADDSCGVTTGKRSAVRSDGFHNVSICAGEKSCSINTGNESIAMGTGDFSSACNLGYHSISAVTGNYSVAVGKDDESLAASMGINSASVSTGQWSISVSQGMASASLATGDFSISLCTGMESSAKVEGKESIAIAIGFRSKAAGTLGSWLVLTEEDSDGKLLVKAVKVDGEKIKENTYYMSKNEKFIETE